MGRHGGINILHQKSWHVWRMDNRLRVERDELQHSARESERAQSQQDDQFRAKLTKLRQRANQSDCSDALQFKEQGHHAPGDPGLHQASSSSSAPSKVKDIGSDDFGKFGVTKSNLKLAEEHLDHSLGWKVRPSKTGEAAGYWGSGGLGSGPHINFFEAAEQEVQKHAAAHGKLLRYAETNNELAMKTKKAPLSEFDEVAAEVPWYMRKTRSGQEDDSADANAVFAGAGHASREELVKRKWSKSHGQTMLKVKVCKREKAKEEDEDETKRHLTSKHEDEGHCGGSWTEGVQPVACVDLCAGPDSNSNEKPKEKPGKKDKKDKKNIKQVEKLQRQKEKLNRNRQELEALRLQREKREEAERSRAASVLRSGTLWH